MLGLLRFVVSIIPANDQSNLARVFLKFNSLFAAGLEGANILDVFSGRTEKNSANIGALSIRPLAGIFYLDGQAIFIE